MTEPKTPVLAEAVALTYQASDSAPRIVAKGRGMIAEQILAKAKAAGVFVHQSPELLSLLMQVDLDTRIPPQLYLAIAELLAWVYQVENGQQSADKPPLLEGLPTTLAKPA